MADGPLSHNAEARFRRRAVWTWRVALFLVAIVAGALAWAVILAPAWQAAGLQGGLGEDAAALAGAAARAALDVSPEIFLALGALEAALILYRFAHGRPRLARNAASLSHAGIAVFLAGLMAALGAPSLLAMLDLGEPALRVDLGADGLALMAFGLILRMAARTLREAG